MIVSNALKPFLGKPCHYCGKIMNDKTHYDRPTRDHKVPVKHGGLWMPKSNIVICCFGCNKEKGSLSYEEFMSMKAVSADKDH